MFIKIYKIIFVIIAYIRTRKTNRKLKKNTNDTNKKDSYNREYGTIMLTKCCFFVSFIEKFQGENTSVYI